MTSKSDFNLYLLGEGLSSLDLSARSILYLPVPILCDGCFTLIKLTSDWYYYGPGEYSLSLLDDFSLDFDSGLLKVHTYDLKYIGSLLEL